MSVTERLENWLFSDKSRSVSIDHGNGYGACCWEVILHQGNKRLVASEVSFFEGDSVFAEGDSIFVCSEKEDRIGLDGTMNMALNFVEKNGFCLPPVNA